MWIIAHYNITGQTFDELERFSNYPYNQSNYNVLNNTQQYQTSNAFMFDIYNYNQKY